MPKRLAIIGAGSAGLITLHNALRRLPGWEIQVYEKGDNVRGAWGNPYPGFISTSTKYTTQFSAFRKYDCTAGENYEDFFRDDEYGNYLDEFAEKHDLLRHIALNTEVTKITRSADQWLVSHGDTQEAFDAVVVATGLHERPRQVDLDIPTIRSVQEREKVRDSTVIVMGGGESAADTANRLALPDRNNTVYLSLRSGIRVSPRYHPIRGVPSDFLRNRLLLSIHPDIRNAIGQKFVETRIRNRELFERLFPGRDKRLAASDPVEARKRHWDFLLTKTAKDKLFNTFHNKSDGFLDAIGEGRIQIIGPPIEGETNRFQNFEKTETLTIEADYLVPQLGYTNGLSDLFKEDIHLRDFYLGCQHTGYDNLFLVGFARPIIGNIPTISEQVAKYVTATLAGNVPRPENIAARQSEDLAYMSERFAHIDIDTVYPVEMFPYCDRLATLTGTHPTRKKLGFKKWLKIQLTPATTMQYMDDDFDPAELEAEKIYTPPVLNILLAIIRLFDYLTRTNRR